MTLTWHTRLGTEARSTRRSGSRGPAPQRASPPPRPIGLTELWRGTVALWEALRRGEPSGRGGYDVGGERWGRRGGSSSRRGRSIATCSTGHRGEGGSTWPLDHVGPPHFRPAASRPPETRTYRLPVLLAPTSLNRKTKRVVGAPSAQHPGLGAEPRSPAALAVLVRSLPGNAEGPGVPVHCRHGGWELGSQP